MGYTMATIKALLARDAIVHVVHWDHKKLTPYNVVNQENLNLYPRSKHNVKRLRRLLDDIEPDLLVVSGWMDVGYIKVAYKARMKNVPVVLALDGQWEASLKQKMASFVKPIFRPFYSHAWVSGVYQYEFARKLGFPKENIKFDLYSADHNIFNDIYNSRQNKVDIRNDILFVGRLETVKGLELLLESWEELSHKYQNSNLVLVGNGSLYEKAAKLDKVIVHKFLQPQELHKVAESAGCFILPSFYEPWGVVLHEFAIAGLPIICSSVCGAASRFVVNTYNGFIFKSENKAELKQCIIRFFELSNDERKEMSQASRQLGMSISPQSSASNLISIL